MKKARGLPQVWLAGLIRPQSFKKPNCLIEYVGSECVISFGSSEKGQHPFLQIRIGLDQIDQERSHEHPQNS